MSSSLQPITDSAVTTPVWRREEIETLHSAQAMYALLSQLQVGDRVPEQCYILDYRDGTIPPWQVYSREQDDTLLTLALIDVDTLKPSTQALPQQWVARRVLAHPTKILASPPYLVGIEGAGPRPMLCDLMQQVRALRLSPRTNRKEETYA